jgi:hypothetical protein
MAPAMPPMPEAALAIGDAWDTSAAMRMGKRTPWLPVAKCVHVLAGRVALRACT